MASHLADHQEIKVVKTISGNSPPTLAKNEKSAQTFLSGVPVMSLNGVIQEWNATIANPATAATGIAGVTRQAGSNYATDGAGNPAPFGQVGAPGTSNTFGKVPYQPSAVNFIPGSPMADGRNIFEVASHDSIFEAQFDDAANGTFTPAITDIGKHYGLTKDATGHWYVDFSKSTQGTNTILVIVAVNPNDGFTANARVWFQFEKSQCQFDGNA